MPTGVKLDQGQYMLALAQICERVDRYNREAESRADRLADIPAGVPAKGLVDEILHWDDLYQKEAQRRKYLQENQMLPSEEPVKARFGEYEVPSTGVELAISVRNLAKNVSTWKGRIGLVKYPDAPTKHAMYDQLYKEARIALNRERSANQSKNQ